MIYLWVAIGGGLGSVARFWLNNAAAAAFGAEFPWGTLLINVIGSFVISFFGTLTSKLARFAVPPEISIFVMVGICGGFTTFSSFSLQTVQLARAGAWDRAIWYVLASVILCLLVCWLGVVAALAIPGRAAAPAQTTMFEGGSEAPKPAAEGAVLALLPQPENVAMLLEWARELAGIYRTPLAALHVQVDPVTTIIPSAEVLTQSRSEAITDAQAALAAAVAREVAAWRSANQDSGLIFLEPLGAETGEIAANAQNAAAVVVMLPEPGYTGSAINAAIFGTAAPVLVVPPAGGLRFARGGLAHIAIGWKDIGHARAAIAAAAPLLTQAERISIIGIGDPQRLHPDQVEMLLGANAARAVVINPPRDDRKIGEQLLAEAKSAQADLLVMGAYRHGQVADRMLGGVTASVLESTDIPLFLKQ